MPFLGPKWSICHEQNFFSANHYYSFHLPTIYLIVQNFKKSLQLIQSYEDAPFLGLKWSICPKQIFFWKMIKITLIYLLAPFIVQNFKKILPADADWFLGQNSSCRWEDAWFLGPKWPIFPNENFFQKTCSWPLFLSFMPM